MFKIRKSSGFDFDAADRVLMIRALEILSAAYTEDAIDDPTDNSRRMATRCTNIVMRLRMLPEPPSIERTE